MRIKNIRTNLENGGKLKMGKQKELDDDQLDNLGEGDNNGGDNGGKDDSEKKFTQAQVNEMMAKEKREGKRSVLNALGITDIEEAKKALASYKEGKFFDDENGKGEPNTGAAKAEVDKELKEAKDKAEGRAKAAENKLACVMAGVNKDSVDDVLSIALNKVSEDKDLTNVLEEMKTTAKYSGFFSAVSESKGTGSDPGHSGGKKDNPESLGKRLAEKSKSNSNNKSSYF